MSSNSNFTSEPSICIPRVFNNITQDFIGKTFNELLGGRFVERVDLVQKTNEKGDTFKRAFIHFSSWPTKDPQVVAVREKLLAGGEVKVMYDDPWFWKCSESKSSRPAPRQAPREEKPRAERRGPYIIGDDVPMQREERPSQRIREPSPPRHQQQRSTGRRDYARRDYECRSPSPRRHFERRSPSPRREERQRRYDDHRQEYRRSEQRTRQYEDRRPHPITVPQREREPAVEPKSPVYNPTTPPSTPPRAQPAKSEPEAPGAPQRKKRINYVPLGEPVTVSKKKFKTVDPVNELAEGVEAMSVSAEAKSETKPAQPSTE